MYDIIGDVHGCLIELQTLLVKLGYKDNKHPDNRTIIFLGDLIDRGWYSFGTYYFVSNLVKSGKALMCRGNHDDKLLRFCQGRNVTLLHGFDKTVEEFNKQHVDHQEVVDFLSDQPYYYSLDNNKLIAVHAAWRDGLWNHDPFSKKCRNWCLFGPNNGIRDDGFPDRIDWAGSRVLSKNSPIIVYGHQPYTEPRIKNNTYGIDTGCVFGGKLTALRYPEMEFVSVCSERNYSHKETKWW